MGTPSYMPPEQAAGKMEQVGPLADVYALGAMLYTLLTGRPPFQAASVMETLKQVCEQEPVPPRQLNAAVDKDLQTICLKAMEKEPANRYAGVGEFAADVERYLANEPILARPISRPARLWRWCQRNPLGAALTGLIAFLAIAGPALAAYQIDVNRKLDAALAGETEQRKRAEVKEREARESERKMGIALKGEQAALARKDKALAETESAIDRYVQTVRNAKLLQEPRFKGLLKLLLKDALAHYRHYVDEHKHEQDRDTQTRIANAFYEIGGISEDVGSTAEAIDAHTQAAATWARLLRKHPNVKEYQRNLADRYDDLGVLYRSTGKPAESLAAHQRAQKILRKLAAENPENREYHSSLAKNFLSIGLLNAKNGKRIEAMAAWKLALEIRERLVRDHPSVTDYQANLARTLNNIGNLHLTNGKRAEALAALQRASKIFEELTRANPTSPDLLSALAANRGNIAGIHHASRNSAQVLATYRKSLKIFERIVRRNPSMTEYRGRLAVLHGNIGAAHHAAGQTAEALAAYQQAVTIFERLARENPTVTSFRRYLAHNHNNIGLLYLKINKPAEVIRHLDDARDLLKSILKRDPRDTTARRRLQTSYRNRARALEKLNRNAEAASDWLAALNLDTGRYRAYHARKYTLALARAGKHARATRNAATLAAKTNASVSLYDLARVYGVAIEAAQRDPAIAASAKGHLASRYSDEALALLRRAAKAGFFKSARNRRFFAKDPDFDAIRHNDEFRELAATNGVKLPIRAPRPKPAR